MEDRRGDPQPALADQDATEGLQGEAEKPEQLQGLPPLRFQCATDTFEQGAQATEQVVCANRRLAVAGNQGQHGGGSRGQAGKGLRPLPGFAQRTHQQQRAGAIQPFHRGRLPAGAGELATCAIQRRRAGGEMRQGPLAGEAQFGAAIGQALHLDTAGRGHGVVVHRFGHAAA